MKNNNVSRSNPYSTPFITWPHSEFHQFITSLYPLSPNHDIIQPNIFSLYSVRLNLSQKPLMHYLVKILYQDQSIECRRYHHYLSNHKLNYKYSTDFLRHNYFIVKPCWERFMRLYLSRCSLTFFAITDSINVPTIEVKLTGLELDDRVWSPFISMGRTLACFHNSSTSFDLSDILKTDANDSLIVSLHSINTLRYILTGHYDLNCFSISILCSIISLVMGISVSLSLSFVLKICSLSGVPACSPMWRKKGFQNFTNFLPRTKDSL